MRADRDAPRVATTQRGTDVEDILFIGIALAFLLVCVAYIRGLDHLVRASEEGEASIPADLELVERDAA
jgi:hypothetical protein